MGLGVQGGNKVELLHVVEHGEDIKMRLKSEISMFFAVGFLSRDVFCAFLSSFFYSVQFTDNHMHFQINCCNTR